MSGAHLSHSPHVPACTRSCWLEPRHPDGDGEQLLLLCTRLKTLFTSFGVLRRSGLLGVCQAYGFRDMGVFFDWASLFQKDPEEWTPAVLVAEEKRTKDQQDAAKRYHDSRNPNEEKIFKFAMGTLDLWYAHAKTTVVLLTELPKKLHRCKSHVRQPRLDDVRTVLCGALQDVPPSEGGLASRHRPRQEACSTSQAADNARADGGTLQEVQFHQRRRPGAGA